MQTPVVIITGASSGIGLAIAKAYAQRKVRVVLFARSADKLNALAQDFAKQGVECLVVVGDVALEADCKRLIDETVAKFGGIDVLVNNAGISMRALFADIDLAAFKQVIDINFWGMVYCTKYAMPYLLKNKGTVVGVSSIAGFKGLPGRTGYSASKFAMNGFLEALRVENLKTGLHVLTLCPGFTTSNIRATSLGKDGKAQGESPRDEEKMMQPDEVAQRMIRAIEKKTTILVLTTEGKLTFWLNKFIPNSINKIIFKKLAREENSPFT